MAGAIQDYRRGLILGEPTYGKGTVQLMWDPARAMIREEDGTERVFYQYVP